MNNLQVKKQLETQKEENAKIKGILKKIQDRRDYIYKTFKLFI
jgi:hypothetical protein